MQRPPHQLPKPAATPRNVSNSKRRSSKPRPRQKHRSAGSAMMLPRARRRPAFLFHSPSISTTRSIPGSRVQYALRLHPDGARHVLPTRLFARSDARRDGAASQVLVSTLSSSVSRRSRAAARSRRCQHALCKYHSRFTASCAYCEDVATRRPHAPYQRWRRERITPADASQPYLTCPPPLPRESEASRRRPPRACVGVSVCTSALSVRTHSFSLCCDSERAAQKDGAR
ncbi:hypothetical protein K466DRAFT_249006 [Polyporus arcularius HHB13444]|uniref:Uncharacterized protein n=1 Tax=Polyporus arcularius HHB13444 TaxID=1314778 RepID=A0A5C3PD81_9APHY|nr:hypothetical protein K466DRAFT_249006 [Polyporus arcularius HHB13444]